jgi:hypothetical protein
VVTPTSAARRIAAAALTGALLVGCSRSPAEPESVGSAKPATTVASLEWSVPPTWTKERTASKGRYRAKYQIPTAGDAKNPADLVVMRVGFGGPKELEQRIDEFLANFERYEPGDLARETFAVGALQVTMVELAATYKEPMGPRAKGKRRPAAQIIKKDYRGLAAAVRTPKRGNWFFRVVGPDDAVQAARSSFRAMLEGLR